jgi:hypothetical protein
MRATSLEMRFESSGFGRARMHSALQHLLITLRSGHIPESISKLQNLRSLNIQSNELRCAWYILRGMCGHRCILRRGSDELNLAAGKHRQLR